MMWLLIHLISFILLIPVTVIGLSRSSEKRIAQWLILNRGLYLLILTSGIVLVIRTAAQNLLLVLVKAALGLAVIALIEVVFGRKQERRLTLPLLICLILTVSITAALGFWLVWGQ